ncbi:hypothetical protein CBR_g56103, partial [Chara braunii]
SCYALAGLTYAAPEVFLSTEGLPIAIRYLRQQTLYEQRSSKTHQIQSEDDDEEEDKSEGGLDPFLREESSLHVNLSGTERAMTTPAFSRAETVLGFAADNSSTTTKTVHLRNDVAEHDAATDLEHAAVEEVENDDDEDDDCDDDDDDDTSRVVSGMNEGDGSMLGNHPGRRSIQKRTSQSQQDDGTVSVFQKDLLRQGIGKDRRGSSHSDCSDDAEEYGRSSVAFTGDVHVTAELPAKKNQEQMAIFQKDRKGRSGFTIKEINDMQILGLGPPALPNQQAALHVILTCCEFQELKEAITRYGGMRLVLSIIRNRSFAANLRKEALMVASALCENSVENQRSFRLNGGLAVLHAELMAICADDHSQPSSLATILINCLWRSTVCNRKNLTRFLAMDGLDVVLTYLEVCNGSLLKPLLTCIAEIVENQKAHSFFHDWRSGTTHMSASSLLIQLWSEEEHIRGLLCKTRMQATMAGVMGPGVSGQGMGGTAYGHQGLGAQGSLVMTPQGMAGQNLGGSPLGGMAVPTINTPATQYGVVTCYICGKIGHYARNCWQAQNKQKPKEDNSEMRELLQRIARREREEEEKKKREEEETRKKQEDERRESEKLREEEAREAGLQATIVRILTQRKEILTAAPNPLPAIEPKRRSPRSKAQILREIKGYIVESDDDSEDVKEEVGKLIKALESRKKGRKDNTAQRRPTSRSKNNSKKGKAPVSQEAVNEEGFQTPTKACAAEASSEGLVDYALAQMKILSGLKAQEISGDCPLSHQAENLEDRMLFRKVKDLSRWRPISPSCSEPSQTASARLGRTLRYMLVGLPRSSHFSLRSTDNLKPSLTRGIKKLEKNGDTILGKSYDIKDMFARLPHADILAAVVWLIQVYSSRDIVGAKVSIRGKVCKMSRNGRKEEGYIDLPFDRILQMVRYELQYTYTICKGKVYQQVFGIPMGKNSSPTLADLLCAKAEFDFLSSLQNDRQLITGVRLLDDVSVLGVYDTTVAGSFGHVLSILDRFESCYPQTLNLVRKDDDRNTWEFLGSKLFVEPCPMRFHVHPRTKKQSCIINRGIIHFQSMQDYQSYSAKKVKKMTLTASMLWLWRTSTDDEAAMTSIICLVKEARLRDYPPEVFFGSLARFAKVVGAWHWFMLLNAGRDSCSGSSDMSASGEDTEPEQELDQGLETAGDDDESDSDDVGVARHHQWRDGEYGSDDDNKSAEVMEAIDGDVNQSPGGRGAQRQEDLGAKGESKIHPLLVVAEQAMNRVPPAGEGRRQSSSSVLLGEKDNMVGRRRSSSSVLLGEKGNMAGESGAAAVMAAPARRQSGSGSLPVSGEEAKNQVPPPAGEGRRKSSSSSLPRENPTTIVEESGAAVTAAPPPGRRQSSSSLLGQKTTSVVGGGEAAGLADDGKRKVSTTSTTGSPSKPIGEEDPSLAQQAMKLSGGDAEGEEEVEEEQKQLQDHPALSAIGYNCGDWQGSHARNDTFSCSEDADGYDDEDESAVDDDDDRQRSGSLNDSGRSADLKDWLRRGHLKRDWRKYGSIITQISVPDLGDLEGMDNADLSSPFEADIENQGGENVAPSPVHESLEDDLMAKIYAIFANLGFSSFDYLPLKDQMKLCAIEYYMRMKEREAWLMIDDELTRTAMRPIHSDSKRLRAAIDESRDLVTRVANLQGHYLQKLMEEHVGKESAFYSGTRFREAQEAQLRTFKRSRKTLTMKERARAKAKKEKMLKYSFRAPVILEGDIKGVSAEALGEYYENLAKKKEAAGESDGKPSEIQTITQAFVAPDTAAAHIDGMQSRI